MLSKVQARNYVWHNLKNSQFTCTMKNILFFTEIWGFFSWILVFIQLPVHIPNQVAPPLQCRQGHKVMAFPQKDFPHPQHASKEKQWQWQLLIKTTRLQHSQTSTKNCENKRMARILLGVLVYYPNVWWGKSLKVQQDGFPGRTTWLAESLFGDRVHSDKVSSILYLSWGEFLAVSMYKRDPNMGSKVDK